jgi:hypothetical protein
MDAMSLCDWCVPYSASAYDRRGKMKLNGWQRIGIVISILWAIGSFMWFSVEISKPAYAFHSLDLIICGNKQRAE